MKDKKLTQKDKDHIMFAGFQKLRLSIPKIKTVETLERVTKILLVYGHKEYRNIRKGVKYEWRAYWFINAWLNKKNYNYTIFMSDLKSDLKGVDIYAISNKETGINKAKVEYTFQVKPKGSDLDKDDYPNVTHFILVGKNFIQIKKNDHIQQEK